MVSNIWVRLTFITASQLEGQDELVAELNEICIVQTPKHYLPAFCSGFEFFTDLFINVSLEDFIKNVVLTGLAWDGLKAVLSKIWSAFKKFLDKNSSFDLQQLQLFFDDAVIRIKGIESYGFLLRLFKNLPHHFDIFRREGLTNISLIELPYIEMIDNEAGNIKIVEACFETQEDEYLWRVEYLNGCEVCYYKPSVEIFV